ncbi:MAG: TonB family protein [Candidatus Kapabacteria bacterium]|nr:TonB family protein [Candidatus Kapabacteria bacterium]
MNKTHIFSFFIVGLLLCCSLEATAQKKATSATEADPDPDDFVMMDKEAVLDKLSLLKAFKYPDPAKKSGIQGTVQVHVLIGKKGIVERYIIKEGVHPLLDTAAVMACMKATFTPAVYENKPIKTWMTIPIIFKLGKAKQNPEEEELAKDEGDGYTRPKYNRADFKSKIEYPSDAKSAGTECVVKIDVLVDVNGKVKDVKETSGCPAILVNEVKRVIGKTEFTCGTLDGKPHEDWVTITVPFSLK